MNDRRSGMIWSVMDDTWSACLLVRSDDGIDGQAFLCTFIYAQSKR